MDFHLCQLKLHCRLCGSLLVHKKGRKQLKASHPRVYMCSAFASELHLCFGLDVVNDEVQIHPHSFCKRCYDAMQHNVKAVSELRHFNSRMELYKWEAHASDGGCKVCDHFRSQHDGGRPHKAKTPLVELLLKHIQHLAPNKENLIKGDISLAAVQPISVLDNLKCSLCCDILHRPIQLPCQTVVCADCLAQY